MSISGIRSPFLIEIFIRLLCLSWLPRSGYASLLKFFSDHCHEESKVIVEEGHHSLSSPVLTTRNVWCLKRLMQISPLSSLSVRSLCNATKLVGRDGILASTGQAWHFRRMKRTCKWKKEMVQQSGNSALSLQGDNTLSGSSLCVAVRSLGHVICIWLISILIYMLRILYAGRDCYGDEMSWHPISGIPDQVSAFSLRFLGKRDGPA